MAAEASSTTQRYCCKTMWYLKNALEMYNMEAPQPLTEWYPGVWEFLFNRKYIDEVPQCRWPGYSFGRTRGGAKFIEKVFPWGFFIEIPTSSGAEYRFDASGTVYCTVHGYEDGIDRRANEARLAKLGSTLVAILDDPLSNDLLVFGCVGAIILAAGGMLMQVLRYLKNR
ncbi:MAG: hypothetical protein BWY66_00930 [bacterium ADurb.Bin374]|nr:MAG: hypothetical protein BWY66_00930 [bacterium ADurb.Bin374]